jgi:2-polyprenyl-3-methyl-5-hydroxy-6-metoxy-1,4-benzoquinol methylase
MPTLLDLANATRATRTKVETARQALGATGFEWYPYDSLATIDHFLKLLAEVDPAFLRSAVEDGVIDAGCGDGELSLAFEDLGCRVTAIDHPRTNHNAMRGVKALKEQTQARFHVLEIDLDSPWQIPERYGLALLLGALYHLKNPFYVLEQLARTSRYCLLSTRIARCYPSGKRIPDGEPVAYLVDEDELNSDNSNFWIFSEAGLRRILRRSYWEVVRFGVVGSAKSDPNTVENDERAFCLLKSRFGLANLELVEGWYECETYGWRWTARKFAALVDNSPELGPPRKLRVEGFLAPLVFEHTGPLSLSIRIGSHDLRTVILRQPGPLSLHVEAQSTNTSPLLVEFELDKALRDETVDQRELGLIISEIHLT